MDFIDSTSKCNAVVQRGLVQFRGYIFMHVLFFVYFCTENVFCESRQKLVIIKLFHNPGKGGNPSAAAYGRTPAGSVASLCVRLAVLLLLLMGCGAAAYGQRTVAPVSGTVTDRSTGEPLAFVQIAVPPRTDDPGDRGYGTVSDINGRFDLSVTAEDTVLHFRGGHGAAISHGVLPPADRCAEKEKLPPSEGEHGA